MTRFNGHSTDPWQAKCTNEDNISSIDSNDMKFSDNFEPELSAKQTNSSNSAITVLPDSQQYIESLERKLDKLKGKTKEVSTKDVINSLATKRDALLQQFLQSNIGREYDFDGQTHDSKVSNSSVLYTYVERRLFPQTQALTAEELQRLLEADILEKINSNNSDDK